MYVAMSAAIRNIEQSPDGVVLGINREDWKTQRRSYVLSLATHDGSVNIRDLNFEDIHALYIHMGKWLDAETDKVVLELEGDDDS